MTFLLALADLPGRGFLTAAACRFAQEELRRVRLAADLATERASSAGATSADLAAKVRCRDLYCLAFLKTV